MKPITIIGGGLAGLTLGIALRRQGVPVTVWEAGEYPRHRVCGEFISGDGLKTLERLELLDDLAHEGVRPATTTAFFTQDRKVLQRKLPQKALCISRYRLDALLAKKLREEGGELHVNSRWTDTTHDEGIVRASGRRAQKQTQGVRWYGLKAHAKGVKLEADLEMHFDRNSYVGLCRLGQEQVNVCGLFRRTPGEESPGALDRLNVSSGSELARRLKHAEWDRDSFCAVAGLPPYPEMAHDGCSVGDALTMPAPVTGNGMSMAFESAEIAVRPLAAYASGVLGWQQAVRRMQTDFQQRFGKRLKWSSLLHRVLFNSTGHFLVRAGASGCWPWLFRATR